MSKFTLQGKHKGVLVAISIGLLAFVLSLYVSGLNALITALVAGILFGNVLKLPSDWLKGISKIAGKFLEFSLLFLAFDISFGTVSNLGWVSFLYLIAALGLILYLSVFLAKKLNCQGSTGWLIGFGTAICGSSAIAALSPAVTENKEDIGISMAVVNLLGAMGMLVFPWMLGYFNATNEQAGIIIGGTLHSVGNVAGAAYGMNNETGAYAIMIKMARVAMLSPALIYMRFLITRSAGQAWYKYFSLPWYLYVFIGISVVHSFFPLPGEIQEYIQFSGKLILTLAMAGIGFAISFTTLYQSGRKGLVFGLIVFALQIAAFAGMLLFVAK
jgi:uncharacterized integral membrane protein (TIGR00698 family)